MTLAWLKCQIIQNMYVKFKMCDFLVYCVSSSGMSQNDVNKGKYLPLITPYHNITCAFHTKLDWKWNHMVHQDNFHYWLRTIQFVPWHTFIGRPSSWSLVSAYMSTYIFVFTEERPTYFISMMILLMAITWSNFLNPNVESADVL